MEPSLHADLISMSPGGAPLGEREVHVWAVPLIGEPDRYSSLLSPAETERAKRFRFADHGRRFVLSHGALRLILAGYLAASPEQVVIEQVERGKPRLGGGTLLRFNLSHSSQLALIAVGEATLGVDLEKVRHLERLRDIAQRHFSTSEFEAIERVSDGERLLAFYRCWTRKESYVKAIGTGLAAPLDVFDVEIGERARFVAFRDGQDIAQWRLFDVSPGPGYVGALAVQEAAATVRRFLFES